MVRNRAPAGMASQGNVGDDPEGGNRVLHPTDENILPVTADEARKPDPREEESSDPLDQNIGERCVRVLLDDHQYDLTGLTSMINICILSYSYAYLYL